MYKYMNVKNIVLTDEFVREPVDVVCNYIEKNDLKKIILTGGRGVGKSTILNNSKYRTLGSENLVIYIRFDLAMMNTLTRYEERFNEHYYEAIISLNILNYIKKYYALTYEKYFNDYMNTVKEFLDDTDSYFNKVCYEETTLKKYLKTGELTSEILNKLKIVLNLNSLTLAIDRFDWVNGNSAIQQKLLSKYFTIFDKSIITSDDDLLKEKNNKNKLLEKGFSFVNVEYNKELDIIKEIVRRRVNKYNSCEKGSKFNSEIITDKVYNSLIDKCEGNISLILNTIAEFKFILDWKNENIDLSKIFDMCCDEQINKSLQLKKMSKPPRLFL